MRRVRIGCLFIAATLLPNVRPASETSVTGFCLQFLDCESELMGLHKRCTESARNATAEACHLEDAFRELEELMEKRVAEYEECVARESLAIENGSQEVELPEGRCSSDIASTSAVSDHGCWRAVARVKQKCRRLEACCPPTTKCRKQVENTRATLDLRSKHVEINRRTLDCRNEMRQVLAVKHSENASDTDASARAHAVLTATNDLSVDPFRGLPGLEPIRPVLRRRKDRRRDSGEDERLVPSPAPTTPENTNEPDEDLGIQAESAPATPERSDEDTKIKEMLNQALEERAELSEPDLVGEHASGPSGPPPRAHSVPNFVPKDDAVPEAANKARPPSVAPPGFEEFAHPPSPHAFRPPGMAPQEIRPTTATTRPTTTSTAPTTTTPTTTALPESTTTSSVRTSTARRPPINFNDRMPLRMAHPMPIWHFGTTARQPSLDIIGTTTQRPRPRIRPATWASAPSTLGATVRPLVPDFLSTTTQRPTTEPQATKPPIVAHSSENFEDPVFGGFQQTTKIPAEPSFTGRTAENVHEDELAVATTTPRHRHMVINIAGMGTRSPVPNTVGRPQKPFLPIAKVADPVEKDDPQSNHAAVFPSADEIVVKKTNAAVYPATDEEHKVRTNSAVVYPATDEVVVKKNNAAIFPATDEEHKVQTNSAAVYPPSDEERVKTNTNNVAVFPAPELDRSTSKERNPTKTKKKSRHRPQPGPGIFRFGHPKFVKPEYATVPEIFGHKQHYSYALPTAKFSRLKQFGAKAYGASTGNLPRIPTERLNVLGRPIRPEEEEEDGQKKSEQLGEITRTELPTVVAEEPEQEEPEVAEKEASSSILQVFQRPAGKHMPIRMLKVVRYERRLPSDASAAGTPFVDFAFGRRNVHDLRIKNMTLEDVETSLYSSSTEHEESTEPPIATTTTPVSIPPPPTPPELISSTTTTTLEPESREETEAPIAQTHWRPLAPPEPKRLPLADLAPVTESPTTTSLPTTVAAFVKQHPASNIKTQYDSTRVKMGMWNEIADDASDVPLPQVDAATTQEGTARPQPMQPVVSGEVKGLGSPTWTHPLMDYEDYVAPAEGPERTTQAEDIPVRIRLEPYQTTPSSEDDKLYLRKSSNEIRRKPIRGQGIVHSHDLSAPNATELAVALDDSHAYVADAAHCNAGGHYTRSNIAGDNGRKDNDAHNSGHDSIDYPSGFHCTC
ncbi:Protein R05G9R.1 [Aphelenchoides avenae]|nr:Protein R05G9R.1 [Aphelenchus avenae]